MTTRQQDRIRAERQHWRAQQLGLFPEPSRFELLRLRLSNRNRTPAVEAIRNAEHPLALVLRGSLPLHPDAAPVEGPGKPPSPIRCGNCRFRRQLVVKGKKVPTCVFDGRRIKGPHVRAWWPGCWNWEPKSD